MASNEQPGPTELSTWERHVLAAQQMGLTQREALELWEDGWPGAVRASRARREQLKAWLDEREARGE